MIVLISQTFGIRFVSPCSATQQKLIQFLPSSYFLSPWPGQCNQSVSAPATEKGKAANRSPCSNIPPAVEQMPEQSHCRYEVDVSNQETDKVEPCFSRYGAEKVFILSQATSFVEVQCPLGTATSSFGSQKLKKKFCPTFSPSYILLKSLSITASCNLITLRFWLMLDFAISIMRH